MVKLGQKSFNEETVSPLCSSLCPDAIPAPVLVGAAPRVGNRARPRRRRPYPRGRPKLPVPFPILLPLREVELERAEPSDIAVVRRSGQPSPPHLDSSHSELRDLAPKLLHPSTSAAVPYPGRNRAQTAVRHCCLRQAPPRASPLSSTTTFRPSFAQNESPVSFPAAYSYSPTLSLSEYALRRRGIAAAPPRTCWAPPVRAAGAPCSRPRPPTARP